MLLLIVSMQPQYITLSPKLERLNLCPRAFKNDWTFVITSFIHQESSTDLSSY